MGKIIGSLFPAALPRTVDRDRMAAPRESCDKATERHGDAVDFRWKGFSDEGDLQAGVRLKEDRPTSEQWKSRRHDAMSRVRHTVPARCVK